MYINFWYPVCTSEELTRDEPLQVTLLEMPLVAFRDSENRPHVLSDTCVHRGGSLSRGKIEGDCVQCPYHGWQFGGDGHCRLIPSLPDSKPPARAKVDSYPTEERYGIVFAFLGDLSADERPPLYEIPEYGQDGWRASNTVILNINCYFERSMENGLDPAHNQFVHPAQGFPPMLMDTFEVSENEWGGRFDMKFGDPNLDMTVLAKDQGQSGQFRAASWFHGPNVLVTKIWITDTGNLVQYFYEAPIDRHHTRIYFINMRNIMLDPEKDEQIMQVNLRVTGEDIEVLEALNPVRTPPSLTREIMTPSDECVVRFREWTKRWESAGWRIDMKSLEASRGDVAYAIPSPDRRTEGNWVLQPVPLVEPAETAREA